MPSIESAKVGDKLATRARNPNWGGVPHVEHEILVVSKLTATLLAASKPGSLTERRFRRKDGMEINGSARHYTSAELLTPELLAEHESQTAALARWQKANRRLAAVEQALKSRDLTVEQMEAIAAAYEATLTTTGAPA